MTTQPSYTVRLTDPPLTAPFLTGSNRETHHGIPAKRPQTPRCRTQKPPSGQQQPFFSSLLESRDFGPRSLKLSVPTTASHKMIGDTPD